MSSDAQKPTSETRVHHPYSPSSLQCREACPKFVQREGDVHEMAITGTKQHDMVDSGVDDDSIPDYRAMAVAECIRMTEERKKLYPGGTVLNEVYLPVDKEVIFSPKGEKFEGTTAGYLDFGIVSADGKRAEILDWKFGNNAVEEASNNLQGIGYALGLLRQFPALESIKVGFIMPHADFVSEHTFTKGQFGELYLRVVTVVRRSIEAAKDPNDFSLATPNTSSCRFCGLIGRCPKVAELVVRVGRKYAPLEVPDEVTPSLVCDPAQVKKGIALADIVKTWAEAYKARATAKTIEDPNFIPDGYTLVSTAKRKVIKAKELAEIAKRFLPETDHDKVEGLYDIALGKVEKLISTAAPRGQKESTVEQFGLEALSLGAVEEGTPFAFLRQARKQDGGEKVSKT